MKIVVFLLYEKSSNEKKKKHIIVQTVHYSLRSESKMYRNSIRNMIIL